MTVKYVTNQKYFVIFVLKLVILIKYLSFILLFTISFTACVTETPLKIEDEKYFAVCELKSNDKIIVRLSESGNVSGELPEFLNDPNSLKLSLWDNGSDNGVNLLWDYESRYYTCDPKFEVKIGKSYRLRGLANYDLNETDPIVTLPINVTIDSVTGTFEGVEIIEGINHNVYSFTTRITGGISNKESFLHFTPLIDKVTNSKYVFEDNFSAYKPLKHTQGFLLDYSRIKNGFVTWKMKVPGQKQLSNISVSIANVDKTYYYYNNWLTEVNSDVNTSYTSPAIIGYGLNSITSRAYISFSALTATTYVAKIR